MTRYAALSLACILVLAACGQRQAGAPPAEATAASEPAAASAPALDWRFSTHGGSGELVYALAEPGEDESRLSLGCLPRSGAVQLMPAGEAASPLWLQSGTAGARLPLALGEATMPTDHPVLADFRRTGRLVVGEGAAREVHAGGRSAPAQVAAFLSYCGAPAAAG